MSRSTTVFLGILFVMYHVFFKNSLIDSILLKLYYELYSIIFKEKLGIATIVKLRGTFKQFD